MPLVVDYIIGRACDITSMVIGNIARGLCSSDVGVIVIRKPKKSKEALSVSFPSVSGNRGSKVRRKERMALPSMFHTCSGKLLLYFSSRSRALSAIEQSSARRPKTTVYGPT